MTEKDVEAALNTIALKVRDTSLLIKQTEVKIVSVREALALANTEYSTSKANLDSLLEQDVVDMHGFVVMSNEVEAVEMKKNHIQAYLNSELSTLQKMNQDLAEANQNYSAILKKLESTASTVVSITGKKRQ